MKNVSFHIFHMKNMKNMSIFPPTIGNNCSFFTKNTFSLFFYYDDVDNYRNVLSIHNDF